MIGAKTTNGAAGDVDGVAGQMSAAHGSQRRVRCGQDGDYVSFTLPRVEDWKRHRTQWEVVQQIRSEIGAKIKVCEQVNDADERIICVSSIDDGLAPMISSASRPVSHLPVHRRERW